MGFQTYLAQVAPFSSRIGARIVDFAVLLGLNIVVNGWFIKEYVQETYPTISKAMRIYQATGDMPDLALTARAERLSLLITLIAIALWMAYEVPAVMNNGETVGKRFLRIRIIDPTAGSPPRFSAAFRRWLILAVPLLFSAVIAIPIWIAIGLFALRDKPARRCIHDFFAGTIVIRADDTAADTLPSTTREGH